MNVFAIGRTYTCNPLETAIPGYWCQSALERSVFWLHKQWEAAGVIADVVLHPRAVPLGAEDQHHYHVDIRFIDVAGGRGECWTEAKGVVGPNWHRNLRDWEVAGPGPLLIFKGTPSKVFLNRVVIPHGGKNV